MFQRHYALTWVLAVYTTKMHVHKGQTIAQTKRIIYCCDFSCKYHELPMSQGGVQEARNSLHVPTNEVFSIVMILS